MNQENITQPKKSIFKRFWPLSKKLLVRGKWVGVILIIFILVGIGFAKDRADKRKRDSNLKNTGNISQQLSRTKNFSAEQLQKAEKALLNGVALEDEKDDFYIAPEISKEEIEKGYNNPDAYRISYFDYKRLSFGADEEYLYFKHEYWDKFPEKGLIEYNGDKITETVAKIVELSFVGKENEMTSLVDGICFPNCGNEIIRHYYFVGWTGEQMKKRDGMPDGYNGMITGGPGYDYILSAYPLADLGLKTGDEIVFSHESETTSEKWHHATADRLFQLPETKRSKIIKWVVGSNRFELVIPDYAK